MGFDRIPRQEEALDAVFKHRYVLYGGSRGPGKSYWLRWTLLALLLWYFQKTRARGVRVGLFCETYPDLRDRQISKIVNEFPLWLGEVKETQIDGLAFFVRPQFGGGILALRNLDDPSKYQSAEFAAIAVDELTKNPKEKWDTLMGSMRWPGIEDAKFLAATNPGGIGHSWVKQLWIDRDFPPELRDAAPLFAFIKALPKDNPFLTQAYWDELHRRPERLRRAWELGDWTAFEGQAFTGWREDLHEVDPFDIPVHWPKWRSVDWGFAKSFCCLWLTRDPDRGRTFVYREVYQAELTDRQQAKIIKDLSPEPVTLTYADPSMWAKKNVQNIVTSTADEYRVGGVSLTLGDNDRLSGKRKVDRLLMSLPDGLPGLQVFKTCRNLTRTMPDLASDKHNPEDVDDQGEDHAYDALRYGLTALRPVKKPRAKPKRADRNLAGMRL